MVRGRIAHRLSIVLPAGFALSVVVVSCAIVQTPVGPCAKDAVRGWPIQLGRFDEVRVESIVEAERRHLVNGLPFGGAHEQWNRLKEYMREGDKLLWFDSPRECYLCGAREGYVVMRGCDQGPHMILVWD
jgi:hypothetical protein